MIGLRTVRAKLTALVALSGAVVLAVMPVLFWILQSQLIDQANDRVKKTEVAFRSEFRDLEDELVITANVLGTDSDTARALIAGSGAELDRVAKLFLDVNPDVDILFFNAKGALVTQAGCTHPPRDLATFEGLGEVLENHLIRGMTRHGCESTSDAAPAYMIAKPVVEAGVVVGAVVVCLPMSRAYLDEIGRKFGFQIALIVRGTEEIVERTTDFPAAQLPGVLEQPTMEDADGKRFVMIRFQPKSMRGPSSAALDVDAPRGGFAAVAALDVSDVRSLVRRNLLIVVSVLVVAASISLFIGWRLASVMSRALRRVNAALKKVEQLEYVHVEPTRTGDELEDLASGFNTMVDGLKERDNMRTTFGKYMTASVMDHLLSGKVALGGVSIPVTILFTDIRSFTTISEKMDAQALVGLLNEYFTEMVGIVMQEEGVVDKYIGDAIMAVFGAPVPKTDDPIHAVRAAVRMRQALAHLNDRLKERGMAPLRTGIGIHTGEVIAGNIGSDKRMEYTVIGDPVNLASRLESSTKDLGVNILISEDTYQLTKDEIVVRPVREIHVKGRAQPVMTYEVLGLKGEPNLPVSESSHMRRTEADARYDESIKSA